MNTNVLLALALSSFLSFNAPDTGQILYETAPAATVQETGTGHTRKAKEEVEAPENAIGKDAAKEKALADAGISAENAGKVKARLSKLDDGTVVYKVCFIVDSQKYSYSIDAVSGAVLDKKSEAVTGNTANCGKNHGKKKQKVEAPENAIGKDAAKEKALADAGISTETAGKVKARVSQLDDGTFVYKVRFIADSKKYSYSVNALSGEILDKSSEEITEEERAKMAERKAAKASKTESETTETNA